MYETDGKIIQNYGDYQEENMLFTYDENERQEHALNKMNAGILLNPKFIPLNPRMLQNGYSFVEATVFGFLDFFLANNEKFYCTNEQIAKMLNVNEKTISLAISKLKENGLIELTYKMRGGGGKIRFIRLVKEQLVMSNFTKSNVGTLPKHTNIYNNIIENKKNNNIIINNNTEQSSEIQNQPSNETGNQTYPNYSLVELKEKEKSSAKKEKESIKEITLEINDLIGKLKDICNQNGVAYDNTKDRMFAKHIITAKEFGEFCEKINQDRVTFACNVLLASIKINYWKGPLAGPMKIYQNYADLYNQAKTKIQKTYTPTIQVL